MKGKDLKPPKSRPDGVLKCSRCGKGIVSAEDVLWQRGWWVHPNCYVLSDDHRPPVKRFIGRPGYPQAVLQQVVDDVIPNAADEEEAEMERYIQAEKDAGRWSQDEQGRRACMSCGYSPIPTFCAGICPGCEMQEDDGPKGNLKGELAVARRMLGHVARLIDDIEAKL